MRLSVTVLTLSLVALVAVPAGAMAKPKPRPNLAASALGNPPSTLARGASLAGTATIANKGRRRAAKSRTAFFLSRDAKRSKDDLVLGSVKTKALRPGKKAAVAGAFKVPATAATSRYRLLVCADSAGKVRESNERDNCRASRSAVTITSLGGGTAGSQGNNGASGAQNTPAANAVPTAAGLDAQAQEEVDLRLLLSGTDADDCELTFHVTQPAHGTVTAPSNSACFQGAPNTDTAGVTYTGDYGYHGPDSFTYTVSDGHHTSAPATVSIDVAALNDAPRITAPDSVDAVSTGPDRGYTFQGANAISAVDGDAGFADHLLVTVSAAHGTVTLGSTLDLTFTVGTGSGNDTTTFHGPQFALPGALNNLQYSPDIGYHGPAAVTITVNDQGNSGPGGPRETHKSVVIHVTAPPVNSVPGTQTFDEDSTRTFSAANGNAITLADPAVTNVITHLSATHGTLHVGPLSGTQINVNASPATLNSLFDGLTYTPDPNYNGPAQIELVTEDAGATGDGVLTDDDTIPLSITAINDPPHNVVPATQHRGVLASAAEEAVTFSPDFSNALSVSDPDVDPTISNLTVTFSSTSGVITLGHTDNLIVTGNGTGNVSLTGTLNDLNHALDGLVYQPNSRVVGGTVTAFTMTTNDLGNTGGGGALTDVDSLQIAYEL